jgi:hypothetical protein
MMKWSAANSKSNWLRGELELEGLDTGRLQEMAQSFLVRVREIVGRLSRKKGR